MQKKIWLCWVLVAACGIFSCSIPDLVFWSGIEPGLHALRAWTLNRRTTREVLLTLFNNLRQDCSPLTLHPLAWSQQQQMVFILHKRHIDYSEMLIQTVSLGKKRGLQILMANIWIMEAYIHLYTSKGKQDSRELDNLNYSRVLSILN